MDIDREIERQRLMFDPQEVQSKFNCNRCCKDIYTGEEYFLYERSKLCEECFDEIQSEDKFEAKRIAGEEDE